MNYLQNHIWCSRSNWDGAHYDCRHLVSLESYGEGFKEDWKALIDESADKWFDQDGYDRFKKLYDEKGYGEVDTDIFHYNVRNLKPEVLSWLHDNVQDRPESSGEDCLKGWCIGDTDYRYTDRTNLTVFFHRKSDAMAFIRRWSKWKKPIHYCQYFTDVRKKLNLTTGKYEEY